jgi:hypothetical protein
LTPSAAQDYIGTRAQTAWPMPPGANLLNPAQGVPMKSIFVRYICRMLMVCMAAVPFSAHAGMVATDQVAAAAQTRTARDQVQDFLGRSEVRRQLQQLGISPAAAQARVNAMTDAEVAGIAGRIDSLPAGGISTWAAFAGLLVVELIWYFWVK